MPRGVYARKSAQQKTVGKGKVKAKTKVAAKAAPKAASQAKATKPAQAPLAQVLTTPAAELAQREEQPAPQFSADDFRKPIADMSGALLRAYARRIGIMQRDVDHLTEDRLRQNCKAQLLAALED